MGSAGKVVVAKHIFYNTSASLKDIELQSINTHTFVRSHTLTVP